MSGKDAKLADLPFKMNDFHNPSNGYSSQNHFSPFSSTYNNQMIDQRDNKERTHPIHKRSRPGKPSEYNRKENQEGFLSKSNQKTERISHPLLFTPPPIIDREIEETEQQQPFQINQTDTIHEPEKKSFHLEDLENVEENKHSIEDESPSTDDKASIYDDLKDQFIAMLEESSSQFEEPSSFYEESSSQFEESSSFYEESSSQFEESSLFYEESSSQFEESSLFYEESSSQFEESSSFYEESSSQFEESFFVL